MKNIDSGSIGPDNEKIRLLFLLYCLIMLPKVDYVLITSLFVCLKLWLARVYAAGAGLTDRLSEFWRIRLWYVMELFGDGRFLFLCSGAGDLFGRR